MDDDASRRARTRAELEAQLHALEEKRDLLEARIEAGRVDPGEPRRPADPAAMLQALEGILKAVQPVVGNMTSAREMLIADRAEALSRDDSTSASEATRLLEGVSAVLDELTGSITQLNAAAEKVRASLTSDASDDAMEKERD